MKTSWMRACMGTSAAWLAAALAASAAYVDLPDGSRREGPEIRARSDGTIILTTPQGQFTYPRGQYVRAVADKPADFDKARQLAAQKQYDAAIKLLEPIIQNMKFLEWDKSARALKGQILREKGDAAGAVDSFEQIFKTYPEAIKESNLIWPFFESMLEAKQIDKLMPKLDEAVTKGSRPDAARAQVLRGDVKMSQGNVEGAVLDYLRSAYLFASEKAVAPEALFKAAEGLEKMRDPRAKELYRKVASEYAGTPWAQKAGGK